MTLRSTPLQETHQLMGAKMVDFSGWNMPIHYGSQKEEHHIVRNAAGMFDVSHMTVLDVQGADARKFLRYLVANNIDKLTAEGKALYTCMLNEQGGVIDDLIVYCMHNEWYRLIVNAATREKDIAWITQKGLDFAVDIQQKTGVSMIAVQGPQATQLAQQVMPAALAKKAAQIDRFTATQGEGWFVARTGYTGEDGYELVIPSEDCVATWQKLAKLGVQAIGLGARDTLRLEAGMALYGNDLDEAHTPLESGLAWTVAMQPSERDFIGRNALQKQLSEGIKQKMVGLKLDGRGILRSHQKIFAHNSEIGEVTSGTFSPTLATTIAIARVSASADAPVEVEIRGKLIPAAIVQYPFVKRGQSGN